MTTATSASTVPLRKREEVAEGTLAFHFAKPTEFQIQSRSGVRHEVTRPARNRR